MKKWAEDNKVVVNYFAPDAGQFLDPFDVEAFGKLKKIMKEINTALAEIHGGTRILQMKIKSARAGFGRKASTVVAEPVQVMSGIRKSLFERANHLEGKLNPRNMVLTTELAWKLVKMTDPSLAERACLKAGLYPPHNRKLIMMQFPDYKVEFISDKKYLKNVYLLNIVI